MPHSYASLLTHIVFSTKDRRPFIDSALEERLYPYLGGTIRELGGKAFAINGTRDHIHLLAEFPPVIATAIAIGKIKGCSSKWIHDTFEDRAAFAWQRGYGAFSVSKSIVPVVVAYIERQKAHHHRVTFQDELTRLLLKHGVSFDSSFLWR